MKKSGVDQNRVLTLSTNREMTPCRGPAGSWKSFIAYLPVIGIASAGLPNSD
jgi:hypothetical protein